MKITTVRHGQTDWNLINRMQGSTDIELNKTGIEQAQNLAEKLKNQPVDIIFASSLNRAAKTAEIINQYHNKEIILTDNFKEINFGIFEGQLYDEIMEELEVFRRNGLQVPEGESEEDFFNRVYEKMDEIIKSKHKNILVVCHFNTIRSIICYFLNLSPNRRFDYPVGNTAIHTFELHGDKFSMTVENDTSHLVDF